jgi:cell division protease FtsH
MRPNSSDLLWGLVILAFALAPFVLLALAAPYQDSPEAPAIALNELARGIREGSVASIDVADRRGLVTTTDGQHFSFRLSPGSDALRVLRELGVTPDELSGVQYVVRGSSGLEVVLSGLAGVLPLLLLGVLLLSVVRQSPGQPNQLMSFGQHRARLVAPERANTRFWDVAGVDEAKQELQEVVEFLAYPEKFSELGARIPRGVLLVGPPGTGKTLLARAVAGEAGVPFFSISGSEFVEVIVGVGASRVRDLFERARNRAPCIVFVDEIDAIGRQRGAGLGSVNDEREQTLNQILVEMDGFDSGTNVIVLAATNRPDVLDPALLRPGRFDRQVVLPQPDSKGRKAILEVHARGKPLDPTVDFGVLASLTSGFSGADLANVINEAAILAARHTRPRIGSTELEEAIDRIIAGPERRSRVISDRERMLTAYHEGGHAIVMRYTPHHDPLHKVTIVPHGALGGYTRGLPPDDRLHLSRSQVKATLVSALGGHAAERVVFGEVSSGSENDLEKATDIARKMVKEYGMSERLGTVALGNKSELVFFGREVGEQRDYSEKTAEAIDQEIRRLTDEAYQHAVDIITEHHDQLDRLADALLQHETLEGDELERIFTVDARRRRAS